MLAPGTRTREPFVEQPALDRAAAARELGSARRRVFVVTTLLALAAPLIPYLTGSWETIWYRLASVPLPFSLRVVLFLGFVHLTLLLVLLPLTFYTGHLLPRAFGLSHQPATSWVMDWLKAAAIAGFLETAVATLFYWLVVRSGDQWWWQMGLALSFGIVLLTLVAPYVLVPIFFKLQPLTDGDTADRIRALARRGGANPRLVASIDFSRRTQEANAAVMGLGPSLRVVIADTLLNSFSAGEVDAVVAHELGHYVHRDVPRLVAVHLGLVWLGLGLARLLAEPALPVLSLPMLAYVPGYPELLFVVELYLLITTPLTSLLSRRLESTADRFALKLTRDPASFIAAMRRLGEQNLAELWPPRWWEVLLGSHPALGRRIARAEAWGA